MPKPVEVKIVGRFCLWVRYDDGAAGEVDLGDLAGRGVFKAWERAGHFESVRIGPYGEICWDDDLDLCPDSVYMRLTGKSPQQVFPNLKRAEVDA